MDDPLAHRGPDGEGIQVHDRGALHHRRLAIIDVDHGQFPMSSDGVVVACNGDLYNPVEFKSELDDRGHTFQTQSDTEVLRRAYHDRGMDCLTDLNGMFAFVMHDTRNNKVVVALDHFGIKPLLIFCCARARQEPGDADRRRRRTDGVHPLVAGCGVQRSPASLSTD